MGNNMATGTQSNSSNSQNVQTTTTMQNVYILDNVEKLIELVEARPALYMRDVKEYQDTALKKKLWQEICAELFPIWGELDDVMKNKYIQDTQKKWLNLRTCFSRELKLQKAVKAGLVPSKRRKYLYFQKLLFLLPTMKQMDSENNVEDSGDEMDIENEFSEMDGSSMRPHDVLVPPPLYNFPNMQNSYTNMAPMAPMRNPIRMTPEVSKKQLKVKDIPVNSMLKGFEENTLKAANAHTDEDTYFVLSLVPQLQSLSEDEKFEAKIGILKLLREIKRSRDFGFSTVNVKEEEFSE